MALVEKKTIDLWGAPVANSAELLPDAGGKLRGLLIEADEGLRFRAAGESSPRFELPWPAIRGVKLPLPGAKGIDVVTAEGRHRLRFTDAVIDEPLATAADGSTEDSFPIEGGPRPAHQTREERLLDDASAAVGAATVAVNFVAADRVRRRRVRDRILARAGL